AAEGKRRQFLRIEVIDSGRGMTQGELDQLFTPFFTTKPSGTGLGLVLSQRIVSLHGGKLWAEAGSRISLAPDGQTAPSRVETADADGHNGKNHPEGVVFCVTLPVGPE